MRMPGQTWAGAAASFIAMWAMMMIAMMLPSLVPMLRRYHRSIGRSDTVRLAALTVVVAAGYFAVWSALGAAVYPFGVALAVAQMRLPALARAVPIAAGVVVLIAGAIQLTEWKARHLAYGRDTGVHRMSPDVGTAWRHGVCLGVHCTWCCAGLTASLLALGVMDLRAMAAVTAAVTAERLAPAGVRVARAVGVAGVAAGCVLIARAVGSG